MSEKEPTHREGSAEERLKKSLRGLPKLKTPWFFEAELQRRLGEKEHRSVVRRFVTRPIPAYSLSVLGVTIAGVLVYFTMLRTPELEPLIIEVPVDRSEVPSDQSLLEQHASPEQHRESNAMVVDQSGRGPSSGNVGATIESRIEQDRSGALGTGNGVQSEPQFETSTQQKTDPTVTDHRNLQRQTPKPVGVLSSVFDSSEWHKASRDSLDSLKIQADSIRKSSLKPPGK